MRAIPVLALSLPLLTAAAARAAEPVWAVRAYGLKPEISRKDVSATSFFRQTDRYDANDLGKGLVVEVRPFPRVGFELAGLTSDLEHRTTSETFSPPRVFSFQTTARLVVTTVGVAVHPFPGRAVDLSLGPVAGYVLLSRSDEARSRTALGGALTLDWPLGGRGWALSATARYVAGRIQTSFGDVRLPMWFAGAGLCYRR